MTLTLTIHHNLFLTRDERYALHAGDDVQVIGVSLPVWYEEPTSTEPAAEVFCRYVLKNHGDDCPVKIEGYGYEITLPRRANGHRIDPELLATLGERERLDYEAMDGSAVDPGSLLDICDGGVASLYYREHNRVSNDKGRFLHVVHFVQIRDATVLAASLA